MFLKLAPEYPTMDRGLLKAPILAIGYSGYRLLIKIRPTLAPFEAVLC